MKSAREKEDLVVNILTNIVYELCQAYATEKRKKEPNRLTDIDRMVSGVLDRIAGQAFAFVATQYDKEK